MKKARSTLPNDGFFEFRSSAPFAPAFVSTPGNDGLLGFEVGADPKRCLCPLFRFTLPGSEQVLTAYERPTYLQDARTLNAILDCQSLFLTRLINAQLPIHAHCFWPPLS